MRKLILLLLLLIPLINQAQNFNFVNFKRISDNSDTIVLEIKYFPLNRQSKAINDLYDVNGKTFTIPNLTMICQILLNTLGEDILKVSDNFPKKKNRDVEMKFIMSSMLLDDVEYILRTIQTMSILKTKCIKYE